MREGGERLGRGIICTCAFDAIIPHRYTSDAVLDYIDPNVNPSPGEREEGGEG